VKVEERGKRGEKCCACEGLSRDSPFLCSEKLIAASLVSSIYMRGIYKPAHLVL
jgi:hypothetical protein